MSSSTVSGAEVELHPALIAGVIDMISNTLVTIVFDRCDDRFGTAEELAALTRHR